MSIKKLNKILLLVVAVGILQGCSANTTNQEEKSSVVNQEEKSSAVNQEEKYQTSGSWAMYDTPYAFAIQNNSYDGDNYKAGEYKFTTTGSKSAVYDIYISKTEYTNSSDVIANEDVVCSAGGLGNIECDEQLSMGDYIYVVPTDNISGSDGWLDINLKQK